MGVIKQIVRNTLSGWLAVGIRGALALIIVPFLLNHLGKEGFGLIGILGVIVSMAAVADLGLRGALGRELAEQLARNDLKIYSELASTALVLYFCLACVLGFAGWLLAPWVVEVLKVSEAMHEDAVSSVRIYGTLSIILSFITPVFSAALSSFHRFDIINSVQLIVGIFSSITLFIVIPVVENPLYGWVGVMLVSELSILFLSIIFFRKFCNGAEIGLSYLNIKRLIPLFHLGGYLYVIQLAQTLTNTANSIVLSFFLGPISVALYQPASKLSAMFNPIVMTLAEQLFPLTTKFHTTENKEKLQETFLWGTKYTLLLGSFVSVNIFIFSEPLARLWLFDSLGDDYLIVVQVMKIFAIVDLMTYASGTQWPVLLGMKKLRYLSILLVVTAILNILVSIYFVGFTAVGVAGVLYGTIISKFIRIILLTLHVLELLRVRFFVFFRFSILGPLICLFFSGLCTWILINNYSCDTWVDLMSMVAATTTVWLFCFWFVGLNFNERNHIVAAIKKIRGKSGSKPQNPV
ncbi:lipopolysaccharide biosynthesis protein [Nitrosomonas sp. wSCUT-2]